MENTVLEFQGFMKSIQSQEDQIPSQGTWYVCFEDATSQVPGEAAHLAEDGDFIEFQMFCPTSKSQERKNA